MEKRDWEENFSLTIDKFAFALRENLGVMKTKKKAKCFTKATPQVHETLSN